MITYVLIYTYSQICICTYERIYGGKHTNIHIHMRKNMYIKINNILYTFFCSILAFEVVEFVLPYKMYALYLSIEVELDLFFFFRFVS